MKKIYINPEIEIVKITSKMQMLAGSDPKLGDPYNGSETVLSHEDEGDDW